LNETSGRFPSSSTLVESSDNVHCGRKSRSRSSFSSTSSAILGYRRSNSKGRTEGTSIALDAHDDIEKGDETKRGRPREKRKNFSLGVPHKLAKVLGLEHEGKEPKDEGKEFKKGAPL
jgi:arrestin-related trafficking adapter 3/6